MHPEPHRQKQTTFASFTAVTWAWDSERTRRCAYKVQHVVVTKATHRIYEVTGAPCNGQSRKKTS